MSEPSKYLHRAALLLGDSALERIASKRVILFGCGGVGSWCAEGLVRSGVRHLTIVDSDCVCVSNINRQLMATVSTIGQPKVDVLRQRLLDINPDAEITALRERFTEATSDSFNIDSYDYVIDAIDSLRDKAHLILLATSLRVRLFSSMGAALKLDPTRIRVAEFWRVEGDPLARALRHHFKSRKTLPRRKFLCVFSDELQHNNATALPDPDTTNSLPDPAAADSLPQPVATNTVPAPAAADSLPQPIATNTVPAPVAADPASKRQPNGSLVHITAIFGFTLAGLLLNDAAAQ